MRLTTRSGAPEVGQAGLKVRLLKEPRPWLGRPLLAVPATPEPAYSRHLVTEPDLGYRFEPAEANAQHPLPTRPHIGKVAPA